MQDTIDTATGDYYILCYRAPHSADVVELVDTPDLGSGDASRGGSSPFVRTTLCPAGYARRSQAEV